MLLRHCCWCGPGFNRRVTAPPYRDRQRGEFRRRCRSRPPRLPPAWTRPRCRFRISTGSAPCRPGLRDIPRRSWPFDADRRCWTARARSVDPGPLAFFPLYRQSLVYATDTRTTNAANLGSPARGRIDHFTAIHACCNEGRFGVGPLYWRAPKPNRNPTNPNRNLNPTRHRNPTLTHPSCMPNPNLNLNLTLTLPTIILLTLTLTLILTLTVIRPVQMYHNKMTTNGMVDRRERERDRALCYNSTTQNYNIINLLTYKSHGNYRENKKIKNRAK